MAKSSFLLFLKELQLLFQQSIHPKKKKKKKKKKKNYIKENKPIIL